MFKIFETFGLSNIINNIVIRNVSLDIGTWDIFRIYIKVKYSSNSKYQIERFSGCSSSIIIFLVKIGIFCKTMFYMRTVCTKSSFELRYYTIFSLNSKSPQVLHNNVFLFILEELQGRRHQFPSFIFNMSIIFSFASLFPFFFFI